jgi:hypothetical protein
MPTRSGLVVYGEPCNGEVQQKPVLVSILDDENYLIGLEPNSPRYGSVLVLNSGDFGEFPDNAVVAHLCSGLLEGEYNDACTIEINEDGVIAEIKKSVRKVKKAVYQPAPKREERDENTETRSRTSTRSSSGSSDCSELRSTNPQLWCTRCVEENTDWKPSWGKCVGREYEGGNYGR